MNKTALDPFRGMNSDAGAIAAYWKRHICGVRFLLRRTWAGNREVRRSASFSGEQAQKRNNEKFLNEVLTFASAFDIITLVDKAICSASALSAV